MMKFLQGNLLDARVEALVNTVNTVGVMGKGIALMFKEAFPNNFRAYEYACKHNEIRVGRMFVTENAAFKGPRWIINFPTKQHWSPPSKIEWIVEGLQDLQKRHPEIGDVDGLGLALRAEICQADGFTPSKRLVDRMVDIGLSGELEHRGRKMGLVLDIGGYYKNVITFAPSLHISGEEIDLGLALLDQLLRLAKRA